ncbi:hypothetical protein G4B88_001101 [Cannabis sativa]|uniref:Uncharacterized protein n=1 Tax=Cannabis sativa TaxID=3483 RepID=A0A7J6E2S6_CANSA|nr:hypothetical protein G4B88_001101 [Cannabis sativa]
MGSSESPFIIAHKKATLNRLKFEAEQGLVVSGWGCCCSLLLIRGIMVSEIKTNKEIWCEINLIYACNNVRTSRRESSLSSSPSSLLVTSHPPVNDIEAPPRLSSAGISASSPVDWLSSLPLVIHDCKGTSERSMFKKKWYRYEIDERLNDVDKSILLFALNFHPEKDGKIGVGAQDIKVAYHKEHENSRCFMLFYLKK